MTFHEWHVRIVKIADLMIYNTYRQSLHVKSQLRDFLYWHARGYHMMHTIITPRHIQSMKAYLLRCLPDFLKIPIQNCIAFFQWLWFDSMLRQIREGGIPPSLGRYKKRLWHSKSSAILTMAGRWHIYNVILLMVRSSIIQCTYLLKWLNQLYFKYMYVHCTVFGCKSNVHKMYHHQAYHEDK
mgnify:CR=1 FL=1